MPGATNSALSLNGDALTGGYRVTVANALGSTASRESAVTALPVFDLSAGIGPAADGFHLRLVGLSGRSHIVIFATTNLAAWWPIHTNPPVIGGLDYLDRGATNFPLRFYRAAETDLGLGPLRLSGAFVGVAGGFDLKVHGLVGTGPLVLLTSTNLADWQPLITNQAVIGEWEFFDQTATNSPARFYRAREQR